MPWKFMLKNIKADVMKFSIIVAITHKLNTLLRYQSLLYSFVKYDNDVSSSLFLLNHSVLHNQQRCVTCYQGWIYQ